MLDLTPLLAQRLSSHTVGCSVAEGVDIYVHELDIDMLAT